MRLAGVSLLLVAAVFAAACSPTPSSSSAPPAAAPTSAPTTVAGTLQPSSGAASGSYSSGASSYGYGARSSAAPTSAAASSSGGATTVSIKDFAFTPSSITIKAGQSLTWTQRDSTRHTVTSDAKDWDSGALDNGKSFSHTFDTAGTFSYHCAFHPTMKGTVIVQ